MRVMNEMEIGNICRDKVIVRYPTNPTKYPCFFCFIQPCGYGPSIPGYKRKKKNPVAPTPVLIPDPGSLASGIVFFYLSPSVVFF